MNRIVTFISDSVGFTSVDLVGIGGKYLNTLSAGEGKQVKQPK